jgi:perosamine synthetase
LTPPEFVHGYQSYVCLFRPEEPTLRNVDRLSQQRNELMTTLEANGISTRQGTHAAALVGFYAAKYDLRPEQFPNAYLAERLSLTLPLFAQMTDDEQNFVCESLEETLSARISA